MKSKSRKAGKDTRQSPDTFSPPHMKHPKSLKVVCAALAVSMVPLFGSCDSRAERAMEELEQIKSSFNIYSIDWRLPDELPEKFTLRLIWVWETAWLEEDKLTLENIHSEQLGRRFNAEEIVQTKRCSPKQSGEFWMENRNKDLAGTPLRMVVQAPVGVPKDSSWRFSIVTADDELHRAVRHGTFYVPYPDVKLAGWGLNSGILSLQFGFDESDVHCHLDFEIVEGWPGHPDED